MRAHQLLCALAGRDIAGGSDDADDIAIPVPQRHTRHHQPAFALQPSFLHAEIGFTRLHDPPFDFVNLMSVGHRVNFGIGKSDQFVDMREAVVEDDRTVGKEETAVSVLGVDEVGHVVDHRLEPFVSLGERQKLSLEQFERDAGLPVGVVLIFYG
ncbi:hypothetical protein FHT29_006460 [Rhizobium sp. SG741]|nr:hypothetical protein [Rhizobium sp. SG741]